MKSLESFARVKASFWPTPIEHMARLSEMLGGPDIFVKRDDIGTLAFGGNKLRKLEYLVAQALEAGCSTVVTAGALQSNHARLTAAVCARYGLACHLVLKDEVPDRSLAYHNSANRFLSTILGAEVEVIDRDASLLDAIAEREEALKALGKAPFVIPVGGSNAVGSLGYANCAMEISRQEADLGQPFDHIFVTSGSGGTHAGLLVGSRLAGLSARLTGVTISRPAADQRVIVSDLAAQTADLLAMDVSGLDENIHLDDGFYLPGYGLPNPSALEAISIGATAEGILLDPVYTSKAMAAVVSAAREGAIARGERILFIHTGGAPALFAYEEELTTCR